MNLKKLKEKSCGEIQEDLIEYEEEFTEKQMGKGKDNIAEDVNDSVGAEETEEMRPTVKLE